MENDKSAISRVQRNGIGTNNGPVEMIKRYVYEGDMNPLQKLGFYSTTVVCILDLVYFPFDIQKCNIMLGIESNERTPPKKGLCCILNRFSSQNLENNWLQT